MAREDRSNTAILHNNSKDSRAASPAVLITRPRAAAEKMRPLLRKKGYKSLIDPMIDIVSLRPALPPLKNYDALIFTSANGVRSFASLAKEQHIPATERTLPVYAVGQATAKAAEQLGFSRVSAGGGTVTDLKNHLKCNRMSSRTRMLYLSGEDISAPLAVPGMDIDRVPVYKARAAVALSPATRRALDTGTLSYALFFSPRTADIFNKNLHTAERTNSVKTIKALCIAESVVESFEDLPWDDVQIAKQPDKAHILALLPDRINPP